MRAVAERPTAALCNALGVVLSLAGRGLRPVAESFRQALAADPTHLVAALNLVEALTALGEPTLATDGARRILAALDRNPPPASDVLDAPHFPPGFDTFRVEWERAAWANPGNPEAEASDKMRLLRWRLHVLLADQSGDLAHFSGGGRPSPRFTRDPGRAGLPWPVPAALRRPSSRCGALLS